MIVLRSRRQARASLTSELTIAMKSLKTKIIMTLIVLWMAGGVISAGSSYWLARKHINELLDAHLKGAAIWLAAGKVGAIGSHGAPGHSPDGFVGQVWRRGDTGPVDNSDPNVLFDRSATEGFSVQYVAGHPYQVYTLLKNHGDLVYQVGQPIAYREETATHAALESLLPTLAVLPLIWLAVPVVVNGTFATLARASMQAERVGIDHLDLLDVSPLPSEVKPFADSVNRMIERLRADIASKKRFIADAAHELRTPITALQLRVDNLVNAPDAAARAERAHELRQALARSATMIRQLLELARADAQLDEASLESVDVRALIHVLVQDLLPIADARSIDLGVRRFEPAEVCARESELRMAVRNLLVNALNHTPEGGRIDIDVFKRTASVVVRVADTGPGIPTDELAHVFDRFYRGQVAGNEGSGLGLSIAQAVVTKYRGMLSLENRTDLCSGLWATVVLPATVARHVQQAPAI
jgi:two-component system OmpR family sensor kinase